MRRLQFNHSDVSAGADKQLSYQARAATRPVLLSKASVMILTSD